MGSKPLSLLTFANILCDWGYGGKKPPLPFGQEYVWSSEVGLGPVDKRKMYQLSYLAVLAMCVLLYPLTVNPSHTSLIHNTSTQYLIYTFLRIWPCSLWNVHSSRGLQVSRTCSYTWVCRWYKQLGNNNTGYAILHVNPLITACKTRIID